eukprot:CAMPEP_0201739282 /NCGR_PEP_ID=MMETSP0593-20130828/45699_1 /ASSEMBLY_ACC=CAM_ASM_000672 /TAXON_ID=267983 /ORGANISM="Skeletonema japonicum, Strain CCMP2506" /LENGTH=690 /DNA_ID=CAMNT_0048233545 /DNA_START=48 /DNA_END=2121 /DNA_ORIENTATION=-
MDGSSKRTSANDNERPARDESNDDNTPWQTGIRRRRQNSNSDERRQPQSTHATPPPRDRNSLNNNNMNGASANMSNPGFGIGGGGGGAAIGVGGPCGGNGVAIGNQSAAFGIGGGGGGVAPSTPYKAPTSSTGKQLVPATPSSVATEETAGSTLCTQTPLTVRRRQSSRRGQSSRPSLRRQYQLLQSQTILLLGGSALGLLLFLFFALPLAAFVSFALMIASIGALVPVASSAARARYELEMQHPLGLLRYLPESLRVLLTETSLHQWMVEGTFVQEYRHLLLYLIPGIEEDQLMEFINRLPPRHRDVLLQPGLGRLIPPSAMRHFIRMDNDAATTSRDVLLQPGLGRLIPPSAMRHVIRMDNDAASGDATQLPQILENDETANVSVASGLTHDHDDHIAIIDEVEGDDQGVSFFEAIASLRETLTSAEQLSPNQTVIPSPTASPPIMETAPATPVAAAATTNQSDAPVHERDDDNSSFDISLDLDLTDIIREPSTPTAAPSPENVVVEVSRSPAELPNNGQEEQNQTNDEEEFEIEGRIISDAINAAVSNYSSQASAAVVENASEVVESASTWLIRTGTMTGFVAGGGGILAALVSSSPTTLSITLGSMVSSNTAREVAAGDVASSSNSADLRNRTLSNQLVNGLLATSVLGFASAGVSFLIRNRVRATIAEKRQKRFQSQSNSDKKDE